MTVNIGGKEWLGLDGAPPRVHADGIALSPDREWLYYHALTGRTLYRVPTAALRDEALPAEDLEGKVEKVAETGPVDGMIFGADGWLYISAIEENAVKRVDTHTGRVEMVVQDPRIQWPDSFALDDKGRIWFTTSRIHLGADPAEPCRIFRIDEVEAGAD
jgi:sugar lactone lactonase YvrE